MTNLLYAHILLDRSGSMESCRDVTIAAFNEYIGSLAADPDLDAAVSLSLFDAFGGAGDNALALDVVHDGIKAKDMPKLTKESYVPRGATPLNDAIGRTVARMDKEWHRPGEKIALVILTDGQENSSREYTTPAVKALLESCRAKNWLIVFLGANQDAFAEGGARGVSAANTMNYSPQNVAAAMKSVARSHSTFGAVGLAESAAVAFTSEERATALDPDELKKRAQQRAAS